MVNETLLYTKGKVPLAVGFGVSKPEHVSIRAFPEEAVYVGDDFKADIIGAKKAGMKTIFICKEPINYEAADVVVDSLSKLPNIISLLSK